MNRPVGDPGADQDDEFVTVTLSRRDVRSVAQLFRIITEAQDQSNPLSQRERVAIPTQRMPLVSLALGILARRRQRLKHFGSMFGEPAWDMLLVLYTEQGRTRLKVSKLVAEAGGPPTTGLRWLEYLEDQQLVRRERDPLDARAYFVELTEKGRTTLDTYLSETLSKGP